MRRHILTLSLLGAFLRIDEVEKFLPLSMGSSSWAMKAVPMAPSLDSLDIGGGLSKPTQSGTWTMLGVPAAVGQSESSFVENARFLVHSTFSTLTAPQLGWA
jgi:hypothetical protein